MKKILLLISAVAAVMTAGSCQKEIAYLEGDTAVSFEITTGDIATRAIADGTNITVLHWELYGTNDLRTAAKPYGEGTIVENDGNKKFIVPLRLVADQDYTIIFWAETEEGAKHYETSDLRLVRVKTYSDEMANDESRAAFCYRYSFRTENGVEIKEEISLKRPFAQINLGAKTLETSLNLVNGGIVQVKSTSMTVSDVANAFNTVDGVGVKVDDFKGQVTFQAAPTPNGKKDYTEQILVANGENTYYWLGMNYLIMVGDKNITDVDVTLNTNMGTVKHKIGDVPIQENFRTNILGDFLTTGAQFEVKVDEKFINDINKFI